MEIKFLNDRLDELNLDNPFSLNAKEKASFLFQFLKNLSLFHYEKCLGYSNFLKLFPNNILNWQSIDDIPAMPVRLFKMHDLYSVDSSQILKILSSSGTSGQNVSRIFLDATTAKRQSRILASITKDFVGNKRHPMIIVDSLDLLKDRTKLNARAAGIIGYSVFGRDHFYCLDSNLNLLYEELVLYLEKFNRGPILVFGFTFVVWQSLLNFLIKNNTKLNFGDESILIHGGGWKKLDDQKVGNKKFKNLLKNYLGISKVFNYYGMVEQVGSIFMECSCGYLHCPDYAEVLIRDPITFGICDFNEEGVVQVLSILPTSYPGHSLLTEDLGTIHGEDDCECGRLGKYFTISGRMPHAELRGCSDTRVV
jgi:phenylacetate-coenzyme A ligase PaaK-like adenylate-forming protein